MRYITVLVALFAVGCASTPNYPAAGVNTTYEILGAKVNSPNEAGWYIVKHNQMLVAFGKSMPSKTDSVIANANVFWVGNYSENKSFLDYVISERVKNDDKKRFVNLNIENKFVTFKGSSCFRYKTLAEDHASRSESKAPFQYFNTIGLFCRHPANKNIAIQIELSFRSDLRGIPEPLQAIAVNYIDSLELVNNRVR